MAFGSLGCGGNDSGNSNSWWIIVIAIIVLYFLVFDKNGKGDCNPCAPSCGC